MSAKLFTPFRSFSGRASGTRCLLAFRKRTLAALTFADAIVGFPLSRVSARIQRNAGREPLIPQVADRSG